MQSWKKTSDPQRKLMGSVLGQDPASTQVSWKSIEKFLCNLADKPTNQERDTFAMLIIKLKAAEFNFVLPQYRTYFLLNAICIQTCITNV